jgi:hypothetical protein
MKFAMYIVAIGWIYVVLMMSIAEHSVIAGIMTFLLYGVLPLTIILYLTGGRQRRRNRAAVKKQPIDSSANSTGQSDVHADKDNAISGHAEENKTEAKTSQEN